MNSNVKKVVFDVIPIMNVVAHMCKKFPRALDVVYIPISTKENFVFMIHNEEINC
jgi:hypothetical protein